MEQSEVNQIVLAAVSAAGPIDEEHPGEWDAKVQDAAARIAVMCSPTSSVSKTVQSVANAKVFAAQVVKITKEASSTRGLVTLKTKPSKFHEDGIEQARTERTDTASGLTMARRIRSLVGHRVLLWVEVESIADGASKVRVIRWVEDLGPVADSADEPPGDAEDAA
jgi:hypothetical protein